MRQIRFLYPPVLFAASTSYGIYLDPVNSLENLFPGVEFTESMERLLAVAATGGISLIVFGFILSSLTVLFVRGYFELRGWSPHEAFLSDDALDAIHQRLNFAGKRKPSDTLYLSATLDHELLPEGVSSWILRRWSMFYLSANCVSALLMALVVGSIVGIAYSFQWVWQTLAACLMLFFTSRWAWRDAMGMLDFQARRPLGKATGQEAAPATEQGPHLE